MKTTGISRFWKILFINWGDVAYYNLLNNFIKYSFPQNPYSQDKRIRYHSVYYRCLRIVLCFNNNCPIGKPQFIKHLVT